jgi:dTDP-4-amino-4,6-dideoxygalactose transaminase
VNSRLDSIQAAVLNAKLPLLDEYNKARQNAARKYSAFEGHKNIILLRSVIFVIVMFSSIYIAHS